MRSSKNPITPVKKRTYTRKAVSTAIDLQDSEIDIASDHLQTEIRIKAYEIFLSRGGQWGSPEQDWLEAEKIILNKLK